MPNIKALRDQRAVLAKEARNLLDTNTGDKWSKDVSNQIDEIYGKIDGIDSQIQQIERQAQIDGDAEADGRAAEARDRVEAAMDPDQREHQKKYSAAFRNFLIGGVSSLTSEEVMLMRTGRPQNAQSGQQSNGSQGGYLVPTGWGAQLLEALKAYGGMRSVATPLTTTGGNPIPWPTVDETAQMGEYVPENTAASAQDIVFGTTSIGAFKCSSKVFTIPFELLQDQGPGIDLEGYIRRAATTRIARVGNQKCTVGTGVGEPTGIVPSSPVGRALLTGYTAKIDPDDLVYLEHSVDPAYRAMPGVGWMFHDNTLRYFKTLKDQYGRPLWLPGYAVKEPDTLLGYRYTINQDMPTMAANAKSVLFGDLSSYMIRDVMEVTLFRFDDSAFITKGQIGFLAWARNDGKLITGGQPVKALQQSAT